MSVIYREVTLYCFYYELYFYLTNSQRSQIVHRNLLLVETFVFISESQRVCETVFPADL